MLIAGKAQVNIQNKVRFTACPLDGWATLYMASQNGHNGVFRMLLEAKAGVNIKTNVSHAAWWCLCTLLIP